VAVGVPATGAASSANALLSGKEIAVRIPNDNVLNRVIIPLLFD
jgi:hypothetical protein